MPVWGDGQFLLIIKQRFWHQRAGWAGLHTFAAAHTGAGAHIIAKIKDDMRISAAPGEADHVIHLHLAACSDAQPTLDARIHINRNSWMAAIRFLRELCRETACFNILLVCIFPQLG